MPADDTCFRATGNITTAPEAVPNCAEGEAVRLDGSPPLRATYSRVPSPAVAEITGAGREWTVSMISELSMPCR